MNKHNSISSNNEKANKKFRLLESSEEYIPIKELKSNPQIRSQTPSRRGRILNNFFNDKFNPSILRLDNSIGKFPSIFNPFKNEQKLRKLSDLIDGLNIIDQNLISPDKNLIDNGYEKRTENYFPFLENPPTLNGASKRRNYINYNQSIGRRNNKYIPHSYKIFNMKTNTPNNLKNNVVDIPQNDIEDRNINVKRGTGKIIRNIISQEIPGGNGNSFDYTEQINEKQNKDTLKVNYTFNDSYNIYTSLPNSVDI